MRFILHHHHNPTHRVIEYYEYLWSRHRRNDVRYDFTQELSDDLRKQVQLVLNKETIAMNPIFKSCSRNAVLALLERLKTQIYLRGDCMVRLGDIGKEMFFLVKGKAGVIIANGKQVAILKDGSYFGELALATHQRRNAHVVARTNCDVRILEKSDFDILCFEFPEISKQFIQHTKMKYTNAVNVSRRQSFDVRKGFDARTQKILLKQMASNNNGGSENDDESGDDDSRDEYDDDDDGNNSWKRRKKKYNKSSLHDKDVKQLAFRLETAASKLDCKYYIYTYFDFVL